MHFHTLSIQGRERDSFFRFTSSLKLNLKLNPLSARMNLSISVSAGGSSPNTRRATTRKKGKKKASRRALSVFLLKLTFHLIAETLGPIDETANVTISLPLSKKAEKSFSVEKKVTNKPSPDVDKEKREGQSDDATTGTEELQHVSAQLAKLDELSSSARRRSSGVRLALQSADGEDQEDEAEEKGKHGPESLIKCS